MEKVHWKQLAANKVRFLGQARSDVKTICERVANGILIFALAYHKIAKN